MTQEARTVLHRDVNRKFDAAIFFHGDAIFFEKYL